MVLRGIVFFLLLTLFAYSQYPRLRYFQYTGTGVGSEREVYTQIDQAITMVCVAPIAPAPANLVHPDFFYVRIVELDTLTNTHGSGADKDSVCFFNAAGSGGSESGITPKGIKRWSGDTVIVGEYLNQLDTVYAMWVISDPSDSFLVTGFYYGNGVDDQTITTDASDSLYGLMVLPGVQNGSQAHFAMWSYGNANCQYFGERGADINDITNNSFDVNEGIVAKMNTTNEWYGYFGVMKDSNFVQTYNYTGNSAANSADTLLFNRTGYKPFMLWGLGFVGGSVTAGIVGGATFGGDSDTSWRHTSTGGADFDGDPAIAKVKVDSLILTNSDDLDLNGINTKIFMFGDTAFYTPVATVTPSRRQPCEGNATINNKGNIQWQDRYK